MPEGYSRELPALAEGVSAGLPRVYDIALETISHGDGRVDPDSLSLFIAAYQAVTPLRLGELWAIPIILRLPLTWIEQQLGESGLSIEQLVRSGNQQQAADQVSISNSIGSLRLLGTLDWREFVEAASLVEQTLRSVPGTAYAAMDFASPDRYRHVIEEVAKAGRLAEEVVASRAIELARASERDSNAGLSGMVL